MANQSEISTVLPSKADASLHLSPEYQQLLVNLKGKILSAQLKAAKGSFSSQYTSHRVILAYWPRDSRSSAVGAAS